MQGLLRIKLIWAARLTVLFGANIFAALLSSRFKTFYNWKTFLAQSIAVRFRLILHIMKKLHYIRCLITGVLTFTTTLNSLASEPLEVVFITLLPHYAPLLTSIRSLGAVLNLTVAEGQRAYQSRFDLSIADVSSPLYRSCADIGDNQAWMLAEYYYRTASKQKCFAIIASGKPLPWSSTCTDVKNQGVYYRQVLSFFKGVMIRLPR